MPVNPLVSRRPGVCDNALPTPASPGRTALGSSSRNLLSPGPDLAARCSDPWWPPSTRLPGPADFKATTLRVTGQDLALLSSRTAAERLRSVQPAAPAWVGVGVGVACGVEAALGVGAAVAFGVGVVVGVGGRGRARSRSRGRN